MPEWTGKYQHEYAQELLSEGAARGEAKILVMALEHRGVEVPGWARERLVSLCRGSDDLARLVNLSLTVGSVGEMFGDGSGG